MNEGRFLIEENLADRLFQFQRSKEWNRIINTFKIPSLMLGKKIKSESNRIYGRVCYVDERINRI